MPCYEHAWQTAVTLFSPWQEIDVELFAPGYRCVSLRSVRRRVEVELEPAIPVKLELVTDGTLPAPPRYLKAVLVPVEHADIGIDWEGPAFGATREITTFAWKPGRMKVAWIEAHYGEGRGSGGGTVREVFPPQYVEVLESDQVQVFEVHLSAAQLERLFREND